MTHRVLISPDDRDLWPKLQAIAQLDPAATGGIEHVVHGGRVVTQQTPIAGLLESGYEEIHRIEPGFCVHVTDGVIATDWRITASSLTSALRLRLVFAGEVGYATHGRRLNDESTHCSFIILPPGEMLTASFQGATAYRYCTLSVTREYLTETLGLAAEELPAVLPGCWGRRETGMGHFVTSKATLNQASRLFNIRSSPGWHDLTVRALSLELLRMVFRDWCTTRTHLRTVIRISPVERNRLIRIREQIDADPGAHTSLAHLAAITGLNRNKLHYGFKQCFGVSLHEYRTERRMHTALQLLQNTDLAVSEIAARLGYEEPTNFTAAFKKHFASLPRELRGAVRKR